MPAREVPWAGRRPREKQNRAHLFLFDCLIVLPVFTGKRSYRHLPEATGIVSGSERFVEIVQIRLPILFLATLSF